MADTPEIKQEKETTVAVGANTLATIKTNEKLDSLEKTIEKQLSGVTDAVNKPPKKDVEGAQETKRNNNRMFDMLKGIRDSFKVKLGEGAGGLMVGVKKVFKWLIKHFMKLVVFGMVGLLALTDMKQLRELWIAFKGAFIAMYEVLAPIAKAIGKWAKETLIPETVKGIIKFWGSMEEMFVSLKENFEGWSEMDWGERLGALKDSMLDVGKFFANTGKHLINWIGKLFGLEGDIFKVATKDEEKMKKEFESLSVYDAAVSYATSLLTGLIGMFAIGKLFPLGWVGKMMKGPLRMLVGQSFFAQPKDAASAVDAAAAGADGKKGATGAGDKKPKPGRDSKGKFTKAKGSIWSKVVKFFGRGAAIFKRIGMSLIMPLMSMGPLGWGLLAALALGGIVFIFWDEISAGVEAAFQFMKDAVKELKEIMKGVMGGAKKMAANALRKFGLDALADKLEGTIAPAMSEESKAERAAKLKKLKEQEKGKARFVKDPEKKLELMQEEWDLQGAIMDEAGKYTDQQNVQKYGKALARQRKLTQLMDEVRRGEKINEEKRKKLAVDELKSLKLVPDELLNVDISGTGQAGFDKLSTDSKMKTNILAKLLGKRGDGLRMTSGWRAKGTGDAAMLANEETLGKNYGKFLSTKAGIGAGLTPEEMTAPKDSKARERGIEKMRLAGFSSQHEHGNALDFSWPGGYNNDFGLLQKDILGTFPGAYLQEEGSHLHMSFDRNTSGMQVAQLQTKTGELNRAAGSKDGSTGGSVTVYKEGDMGAEVSVNGKTPRNGADHLMTLVK